MKAMADVLVIGGGPAGLAAAIAAQRKGLRVAVADGCKPPIDKACGEGLLPEGVTALRHLGVDLNSEAAFSFRGIRFADEESSAAAMIPHPTGFGLRRTALHRLLVQRATDAGVELRWGAPVSYSGGQVKVQGQPFLCRWIVGADGQASSVRKWAGLEASAASRARFGFRRHYEVAPWTDLVEVHWGERTQLVITPTGPDEVGVSILSSDPAMRLDRALPLFPSAARKLSRCRHRSTERGDQTAVRRLPAVFRGRFSLVGDASGSVDAITGHGLSLAFQQALRLAEALEKDNLPAYQAAHEKIVAWPLRMARLMLIMDASAWVRRRALRIFQSQADIFARMLAPHTGAPDYASPGLGRVMDLGRRAVAAQ